MTSETGDLLEKPPKKGTFVKGYDPRRNLRGVPKEAIAMRKMLRKIAAELVAIKDEKGNEVEVTRLYARARLSFSSRNYKEFEMVMKAMFPGLLRDEVDITSKGEKIDTIGVKLIDYRTGIADIASGPGGDHLSPSQDENPGDGKTVGQNPDGR